MCNIETHSTCESLGKITLASALAETLVNALANAVSRSLAGALASVLAGALGDATPRIHDASPAEEPAVATPLHHC